MANQDAGIVEARAKGDTAKLAELEAGRRLVTAVGVPGANAGVTDKIADEIEASARSGKLKVNTGIKALDAKAAKRSRIPVWCSTNCRPRPINSASCWCRCRCRG
ncbi:hypothetical protein, partial [Sandarakinorhabdus limnophila]|uniref:hypothetical protein n=1 Tax=Sandarakinorhabdus limnophila TaxID=210512 RepID=UPI0026EDE6FE